MTQCIKVLLILFALMTLGVRMHAEEMAVEPPAKSPNDRYVVVNVLTKDISDDRKHFEIQSVSGEILASELDQKDLAQNQGDGLFFFEAAEDVLWRPDSKMVAITTRTSKFNCQTLVFSWDGTSFRRVELPAYEADTDNTFRQPQHWEKNDDLVLDISLGHHTKAEPPDLGYNVKIHFSGVPLKGAQISRTPTVDRDADDEGKWR